MNNEMIVPIDTKEGCQKATSDLDAVNKEVLEEQSESQPLGCYMYTPRNELVFNMGDEKTGKGLPKDGWSDDMRKVCRDFEAAMSKSGGKEKYRADSLLAKPNDGGSVFLEHTKRLYTNVLRR